MTPCTEEPADDCNDGSSDEADWRYKGEGIAHCHGEYIYVDAETAAIDIFVHPVRKGKVKFEVIHDRGGELDTGVLCDLDPNTAEVLAHDLLECAAAARQQQSSEGEDA